LDLALRTASSILLGKSDNVIADSETGDAGTEFGHHPREVAP